MRIGNDIIDLRRNKSDKLFIALSNIVMAGATLGAILVLWYLAFVVAPQLLKPLECSLVNHVTVCR